MPATQSSPNETRCVTLSGHIVVKNGNALNLQPAELTIVRGLTIREELISALISNAENNKPSCLVVSNTTTGGNYCIYCQSTNNNYITKKTQLYDYFTGFFHSQPSIMASPHSSITFALNDVAQEIQDLFDKDMFTPNAEQLKHQAEISHLKNEALKSANHIFPSGTIHLISPILQQQGFSFASITSATSPTIPAIIMISDDQISDLWFTDGPTLAELLLRKGSEARHSINKCKSKEKRFNNIVIDSNAFLSSAEPIS